VYAAGMAVQTVGEEHQGRGPPLQLCYLQHAFGLGQHYNSLKPLGFALPGAEEGEEGEQKPAPSMQKRVSFNL
jgi:OTU domain-containing protein 6